jgi:Domain of unknown function (DUF4249)
MKKLVVILSFLSFILSSCLDEVKIPLRQETEKMIVEGLFTNDSTENFLRLSLTTQYGTDNTIRPVSDAFVEVRSTAGAKIQYRKDPRVFGVFKPEIADFNRKIGDAYYLYIKLADGREYTSSPEKIENPVSVKDITAKFRKVPSFGYEVFINTKDPKETVNFYRWETNGYHVRRSGGTPLEAPYLRCNVPLKDDKLRVLSDVNVNGSLIIEQPVFFSPFYATGRHYIEVKQFGISRNAYLFWKKYEQQRVRTGTIFDPLPAALYGNVKNMKDKNDIAIGYFEVASISKKKTIIPDTLTAYDYFFDNPLYLPPGDCMLIYENSIYSDRIPKGW